MTGENCKRCGMPTESIGQDVHVCGSCGQVSSRRGRRQEFELSRRFVRVVASISAALIVIFALTVDWGGHSLAIIPLKVMQSVGLASSGQLESVASICKDRGKPECVEKALRELSEKSKDLDFLAQYGKILSFNKKYGQAIETYERYFDEGGISLDASYEFAKVLSATGQVERASQYFLRVLRAKPDVMQVTVSRAYVDHLIKNRAYGQARRFILDWRSKGANTVYFLEERWRKINEALNSSSEASL